MNCVMCHGEGRIAQRGAESSGAREVCPTCNGTGVMPAGQTEETHVFNVPEQKGAGVTVDGTPIEQAEFPKADGAPDTSTDSSSGSESGAPEADQTQTENPGSDVADQSAQ